jgi:poly(3-hydroxybutyrate) depolymerase
VSRGLATHRLRAFESEFEQIMGALRRGEAPALVALCLFAALASAAHAADALKSYNVVLNETSVSGISSGAFMAVQFGVANSAVIAGVGATAGGPYFCAGDDAAGKFDLSSVLARCMQGDPLYPKQPINKQQMTRMFKQTNAWAKSGKIDATANLARQKIWLFHGYNDGVVKAAVAYALYAFYAHYVNPGQIFYKNNLKAGHAQLSGACSATSTVCNACDKTGGDFINLCQDDPGSALYDAEGILLQHIYGTLNPKNTTGLTRRVVEFSQTEFTLDAQGTSNNLHISMADTGYVYVPADCEAMQPCRVHIAFHGCQQSAEKIKNAFYQFAGYNEWADANHLIVLYPQTIASYPILPSLPSNPQGCWDWWGYNDFFDSRGKYATKQGLQIAAVRRMLDRLAGNAVSALPSTATGTFGPPADLAVGDVTHRQALLRWRAVKDAASYNLYRAKKAGGPYAQKANSAPIANTTFVDSVLTPKTGYFYVVKAVDQTGSESAASSEASIVTAASPPPCDPYFSLMLGPVTKNNQRTTHTCQ